MDLIRRSFDEVKGIDLIWQLIVSNIPEFRFDSRPTSGLTLEGSSDLVIEGKITAIDYVKYFISRRYEFPMLEIRPTHGSINAIQCSAQRSQIIYCDKEHVLFQWKPTTADMASDRGMGWSCYYEAMLAIWYTK